MRRGPLAFGLAALSVVAVGVLPFAGAAADQRADQIVATVGSVNITVGDLERRLKTVPRFQFASFGKTPEEVRRAFLERVLIPEALLSSGAKAEKLDLVPAVHDRVEEILRTARIGAMKAELVAAGVSRAEMQAYYDQNLSRFQSPERIAIWRILCAKQEEAKEVLASAKQDGRPQHWNDLSRTHSIDKTTALRGGNIGFVSADGASTEPNAKVDPALFAAASKVKDGELVGEPVPESGAFAVVWRRGATPAVHRTLEEEEAPLRQVVLRQKLEQSVRRLLKNLRESSKVEANPALVETLEVDSTGQVAPRRRPGVVPRTPSGRPEPAATPRGLR